MKIEINERTVEKAIRAGSATVFLVGAAVWACAVYADPDIIVEKVSVPHMLTLLLALISCMFAYMLLTRETR